MATITAIAASTAVKTTHPSRDTFLNLLILSSSSGTNTYIRFPALRMLFAEQNLKLRLEHTAVNQGFSTQTWINSYCALRILSWEDLRRQPGIYRNVHVMEVF